MREIKFRAWDKELKKMFYADAEQLDNGLALLINGHFDDEDPVWMQYTGLKDKNGKEIYEGDLVEHEMETDGEWDKYEACEVVFDETYGMYCFKNDAPNSLKDYRNLEVIGNIYES